ncbi:MAG: T9SS type A sorting domain-containing protein, partial [Bacteroidetes bacterium]|nr:T9SS type A sorting domain-containing protein [Bacteroidota bacterium]
SQSPFLPDKDIFFGDYTNISAYNGIIRPIWTRLNNGQLSIWTDITSLHDILFSIEEAPVSDNILSFENYPNPASDYTFVSYKLHERSNINLSVYNLQGNVVSKIINNESKAYGKYIERICLDKLNIPSGVYFLKLEVNDNVKTARQILIK